MKNFSLLLPLCITFLLLSCARKPAGDLPVINLTETYPKKDIILQEIANVTYISLNGKDAPLIGRPFLGYVSQEFMILYDFFTGDVFVLEKDGTIRNHFNHKGNSGKEYGRISHLTYDPKKMEIYILDAVGPNGILVYSESGHFLRSFPELSRQSIQEIYDFDNHSLLAYCMPSRFDPENPNHTNPYLFLSKEDGKIESRLRFQFLDRITSRKSIPTEEGVLSIMITGENCVKYGNDFIFADISSDTLFSLSKDHILKPLLVRTPLVHDQDVPVVWSVGFKTDSFILIHSSEYDFKSMKKAVLNNQPIPESKSAVYLYYVKSNIIVTPNFVNRDWPSKRAHLSMRNVSMDEKNMSVDIIQAEKLTEALEKGELQGELKEVALSLASDDNPIVMVVRFK